MQLLQETAAKLNKTVSRLRDEIVNMSFRGLEATAIDCSRYATWFELDAYLGFHPRLLYAIATPF